MSERASAEWITPAEAVGLLWVGPFSSVQQRGRIVQHAREGFIHARVRDFVRRSLVRDQGPADAKTNEAGIQLLGTPLPVWDWPIEKTRLQDVELDEDDWLIPELSDVNSAWWETADLELFAANGTREGISMFGIEFLKADIERLRTGGRYADQGASRAEDDGPQKEVAAPRPAADAAIRAAVADYLENPPDPRPSLKHIAELIRSGLAPASTSRDQVIAIIKELSETPRPGPR